MTMTTTMRNCFENNNNNNKNPTATMMMILTLTTITIITTKIRSIRTILSFQWFHIFNQRSSVTENGIEKKICLKIEQNGYESVCV